MPQKSELSSCRQMIVKTGTVSLAQAQEALADKMSMPKGNAWIGFDTSDSDRSPLRDFGGDVLVLDADDWDPEGRHAAQSALGMYSSKPLTMDHARAIVAFVLRLHGSKRAYIVPVHCYAGMYRSGAVVEWMREDLKIPEAHDSNRLARLRLLGEGSRTYNKTLLSLLRAAHRERAYGPSYER